MKSRIFLFLATLCATTSAAANEFGETKPLRPVSTYSIVAHDAESGEIGVAVQSHWFSVGIGVPWVEAGVGAVATQSFTEISYGPKGLNAMRDGVDPKEALAKLVSEDENENVRQVGFVDATGRVAGHTGSKAITHACDQQGEGYSVQANLMENDTVCSAMATAFEDAEGDLAERLMAALEAAQSVGGDIRGMQSAAMKVVRGERVEVPLHGLVIDIHVADHTDPLAELRRLLVLNRAFNLMNAGDAMVTAGEIEAANEAYSAASALAPDNHEMLFWRAVTLASAGDVDESLPLFAQAFAAWPKYRELVTRLPHSDLLPDDDALMEQILAVE